VRDSETPNQLAEDQAKMKELLKLEDEMLYATSLLNYSIYVTEPLDSTVDSSSGAAAATRRSTRYSEEEATMRRKIDDELEMLIEEY
jgi:hypothetical protein